MPVKEVLSRRQSARFAGAAETPVQCLSGFVSVMRTSRPGSG